MVLGQQLMPKTTAADSMDVFLSMRRPASGAQMVLQAFLGVQAGDMSVNEAVSLKEEQEGFDGLIVTALSRW
jgi:hypothetical protein